MATRKTLLIASGVAACLMLGAASGLLLIRATSSPPTPVDHRQDDEEAISGAKIAIENRFPEAQVDFGQSYVRWNQQVPSVCGRVDIVQEQDSFDGEGRYVSSPGQLLIEEADGSDVLSQKWGDVCA